MSTSRQHLEGSSGRGRTDPSSEEQPETLPAETVWFQENVGTERCPQGGRSLDHQVLPVHLAPSRQNRKVTITNK